MAFQKEKKKLNTVLTQKIKADKIILFFKEHKQQGR